MEPLSPLSSTNPRSLARFRSMVRPKIRKLPFAVAYLWICCPRQRAALIRRHGRDAKSCETKSALGWCVNKHLNEEADAVFFGSIPNQIAMLIEMCRVAARLFEEVAKYGEASVPRIYGDFSGQRLKSWADILQKYTIDPYQQFAYTTGKNASDIALVIDAIELLHSGRFTVSVLSLRTAPSRALRLVCGNRVPMSSASASRRPPRVSGRRAASSSTLRTCYGRGAFRQSPATA